MSVPLSQAIASPLARVRTPLSLSATEICMLAHSPSAMARMRGRGLTYKVLGPGGTYGKLTGVPKGGLVEGARLSVSKVLVGVAVQAVALGAHEFPLERVDIELTIRLNPDGGYGPLLDYVKQAGPDFLTTVDADLAEAVKQELHHQVSSRRAVDVYRDGLSSLQWERITLLDRTFVVEHGRVTDLVFHPKHREVVESQINELAQQTLHGHQQAELVRQRTLKAIEQETEVELETGRAKAELAIDSARWAAERPYERERDAVELTGKLIETLTDVRGGAAAELHKDMQRGVADLSAAAAPLQPPAAAGRSLDEGYVDGTAHTVGFEPVSDDPWMALLGEAGVEPAEVFAVGSGQTGVGELLVVATHTRPPHPVRVRIRHLLDGKANETVLLSPVSSPEELVLEFLLHYEPGLEECEPEIELRAEGDHLTVALSGSPGPLRPHVRRFIDPETRLLNGLLGVLPYSQLDLVLA